MRINSINIENFRGIRSISLQNISDAIVVAGPNGCGKSSIFDAIRLLKSAYGAYNGNEFQTWFSEFQINVHRIQQELIRFLYDSEKPLFIKAEFSLSESEKAYIRANIFNLASKMTRSQYQHHDTMGQYVIDPASYQAQLPVIEETVRRVLPLIDSNTHEATLLMDLTGHVEVTPSPILQLVFSTYQPQNLGVIDYHSADRNYTREHVGGINLQIEEPIQRRSQHALYNTQGKYHGVKTEMAQSFVRQLLAKAAGIVIPEEDDLKKTLDELFSIFFPGKKFLGAIPTPDGGLSFPVRLENGHEHDINELSSGEKEVLLGYLRLRNNAPKNSIIMIDEPELHLNPRLIRGLPRFYQKHLGEALNNQIWLITHSDALLREAVEEPAYSVFHMHTSYSTPQGSNQLDSVNITAEVERAVIDLIGDLATYSPRSKVVLLEGEGSEVDEHILKELFPDFVERVNLLSVGSKRRVGTMHDILERAAQGGKLDARFYSVVDRDFGGSSISTTNRRLQWDVYHIENYLLEPIFIREAMHSLMLGRNVPTEDELLNTLKLCAQETVNDIIRIKMEQLVNDELVSCISIGVDRKAPLANSFRNAAERAFNKMKSVLDEKLSTDLLNDKEREIRADLHAALADGRWKSEFRGRDILKLLTTKYKGKINGVSYEVLRNLIVNRMRESEFRPLGMSSVVNEIMCT